MDYKYNDIPTTTILLPPTQEMPSQAPVKREPEPESDRFKPVYISLLVFLGIVVLAFLASLGYTFYKGDRQHACVRMADGSVMCMN